MKKILFASTALVATAGVAAADINFGGYGRFGVRYDENRGTVVAGTNTVSDTVIVSRFRMNIDGDATTDGGVRFSARVRLQAGDARATGDQTAGFLNGARFSVEYEGLRVDVGNAAGAIDNLPNYYGNEPGLTNFVGQYAGANYGFQGYTSGGAGSNAVYARYAVGDFAVAASYDEASGGTAVGTSGDRWDIHAAYTFGNITAALAYGETDTTVSQDMTVLTLGGSWGAFSGTFFVGDETVNTAAGVFDASISDTFYGLSAAYDVSSATTITASYGDGSGTGDAQAYGLGVIHDLGGGVSLRGGVGSTKTGAGSSSTVADFGAQFSF
mgnify:CR=1 FL=1